MIAESLRVPREMNEILDFAIEKGIYRPGHMALFHALDKIFKWLGLRSRMLEDKSLQDVAAEVQSGAIVLMESRSHVIVIDRARPTAAGLVFDIRDPAMTRSESVPLNDYRLKGTGRIWSVRK